MKKLIVAIVVLALVFFLGMLVGSDGDSSQDDQVNTTQVSDDSSYEDEYVDDSDYEEEPVYKEYHFRSNSKRDDHYYKHGRYMGFEDPLEYEKAANDVINNPKALTKTEAEDGDYVYYVEDTNEFVVLSTDGYIRTYFEPDAGKRYFDKQ